MGRMLLPDSVMALATAHFFKVVAPTADSRTLAEQFPRERTEQSENRFKKPWLLDFTPQMQDLTHFLGLGETQVV